MAAELYVPDAVMDRIQLTVPFLLLDEITEMLCGNMSIFFRWSDICKESAKLRRYPEYPNKDISIPSSPDLSRVISAGMIGTYTLSVCFPVKGPLLPPEAFEEFPPIFCRSVLASVRRATEEESLSVFGVSGGEHVEGMT